jgi:hypothetical protein
VVAKEEEEKHLSRYNWESPYDRFHTYLAHRDGVVVPDRKPKQAHLKVYHTVYGCKAFALTTGYLKKENRLHRFNPKAWIGYLVGYDSTNVYWIWNPIKNTVIQARDVIFDEDQVFDGNLEKLRDDCLDIDLDDLSTLLTQLDVSQRHENDPISDNLLADDDCILVGNPGALDETVSEPDEGQDLMQLAQQALDAIEQGPSLTHVTWSQAYIIHGHRLQVEHIRYLATVNCST